VRVLWSLQPVPVDFKSAGPLHAVSLRGEKRPLASSNGIVTVDASDAPVFLIGTTLPAAVIGEAPEPPLLADSVQGFSGKQGEHGWTYGVYADAESRRFRPAPNYRLTDWRAEWVDAAPHASITAESQHPGAVQGTGMSSVRRWTSGAAGAVRITGKARVGAQGDGVEFQVLVDGQPLFSQPLGGGAAIATQIDVKAQLARGSTVDVVVSPGPKGDVAFDETHLHVRITGNE
jgi:hypothetical protein